MNAAQPLACPTLAQKEAERSEFPSTGGLRLYRLAFFLILRTLIYALIVLLATLSGLAFADLLGAVIFD